MNQVLKMAMAAVLAAPVAMPAIAFAAAPAKKAPTAAQVNADDIAAIRAQMQALADRLQKLEQTNQSLETQNAELKKSADDATKQVKQVQADTDATIDQLAKTRSALPEWVSRINVKGDFRYRHEDINSGSDAIAISNGGSTNDRERERIRARLAITAKVNDAITVGVRLATSETGSNFNTSVKQADGTSVVVPVYDARLDPRSPNVTLGGYSAKKTVAFDQAYVEWAPSADFKVTAGKMAYPWARPTQSLFFDGDINPEGVAVNFNHGYFFANAFYFWLNEVTTAATDRADANMNGGQVGIKYPISAKSNLTVAVSYQKNGSVQGRATSTFFGSSTNGNSTKTIGTSTVLRDEFKIAEAFAEYTQTLSTSTFGDLPLGIFAQYAKNSGAAEETSGTALGKTLDKAYSGGISLGKAAAPGTWEVAYMYQKIEKNALFGQWIDSDFGNGNTDTKGHVIKAGYAPYKNTTVNLTYFINKLNVDAGKPISNNPQDRNYDRLQLDFNFKY
jgi:Putative porin